MLHHVALEVRAADTDAEVAFWALLGFDEVDPPPSLRGRARWVQCEDRQVHLLLSDDPTIPPEGHVAVVADPARVVAAGHPVEERTPHWGSPRWVTRTPAGHRVEVMHFPPT